MDFFNQKRRFIYCDFKGAFSKTVQKLKQIRLHGLNSLAPTFSAHCLKKQPNFRIIL